MHHGERPLSAARQVSTTICFDADVLAAMEATGPGWQQRINDAIRALFFQSTQNS
ncbi:BrnA antitoxin family protein [Thiorhodovibrio litoralis]|uniref:BrnA antitoxin family protein n=1 Tax=Thiorhodovibrio litoralis TaxID=2952932 RepID=UPI001F5D2CB4|nr:BrnA antitoxin family protein [Thiorhodovibrio litoralis]